MSDQILRNLLDACERGRPLADIHDRLRVEVGRLDAPAPTPAVAAPTKPWSFTVNFEGGSYPTDYGTGTEWDGSHYWVIYHGPHEIDDAVLVGMAAEDPTAVLAEIVAVHNGRAGVSPQPEITDDGLTLNLKRAIDLVLGERPQPEITRQQIAKRMGTALSDWARLEPTGALDHHGDGPLRQCEFLTDYIVALLADGATPAGPEPLGNKVVDLMDELERSVKEAKASRKRKPSVGATPAEDDQP